MHAGLALLAISRYSHDGQVLEFVPVLREVHCGDDTTGMGRDELVEAIS